LKIANGNLLSQSGAGKAVAYTYDVYNRLVQYAEGEKKETYTYDAEGVRRSKVNGDDTIYYISDTTGSLSYTLAETDKSGEVIATYNRADVLISQVREEVTSYYLFDGHGDVRALNNEEGRITDKYRYNAYGELVERSGETGVRWKSDTTKNQREIKEAFIHVIYMSKCFFLVVGKEDLAYIFM